MASVEFEAKAARRGSQKWLQLAVSRQDHRLRHQALGPIDWVSPVASDGFREYADAAFLERIGKAHLAQALSGSWPAGGPRWDALGVSGERVILVEAKAHLDEFFSSRCAASPASRTRIEAAFAEVREALRASGGAPWTDCFYQYANRLAHLHFLRRNGVDAVLLLVGFVNDHDMRGPTTAAEWATAYRAADYVLGLPRRHALSDHVLHVHPDVGELSAN